MMKSDKAQLMREFPTTGNFLVVSMPENPQVAHAGASHDAENMVAAWDTDQYVWRDGVLYEFYEADPLSWSGVGEEWRETSIEEVVDFLHEHTNGYFITGMSGRIPVIAKSPFAVPHADRPYDAARADRELEEGTLAFARVYGAGDAITAGRGL